jgi:MinD superfamily P-loop ATPase
MRPDLAPPPAPCNLCGCDVCGCTAERRAMRDKPWIIGVDYARVPAEVLFKPVPMPAVALTLEKLRGMVDHLRQQQDKHFMDAMLYGMGAHKVSGP